jgi:hypothetical protein
LMKAIDFESHGEVANDERGPGQCHNPGRLTRNHACTPPSHFAGNNPLYFPQRP